MNVKYMLADEKAGNKIAFTKINSPAELKKFQQAQGMR